MSLRRRGWRVDVGRVSAALVRRRRQALPPLLASLLIVGAFACGTGGTTSASAATGNPLAGWRLYLPPHSPAAASAAADPAHARLFNKIARTPHAVWLTGGSPSSTRTAVARVVAAAASLHQLPVLVAYAIPRRDCGSYSGGGAASAAAYRAWIGAVAAGIGRRHAVVVLEPDALAGITCLSTGEQSARLALLRYAVSTLRRDPAVATYLDAGHAQWVPAADMARRLIGAGVRGARGFSLNVSNFDWTRRELGYGDAVARAIGTTHFVVDSSRNGRGPAVNAAWCNPPGRGLGARPTTATGDPRADALLWIKAPGESDGNFVRGAPPAGQWWPSYALGLAQRASW